MLIQYVGTAHYRVLSAADAKRADPPVEGFTKTTWTRNGIEEVSDAAGEWLLRDLGDEFIESTGPLPPRTLTAAQSRAAQAADETVEASGGGDAPAGKVSKSSTSTSSSKTS